MFVNEHNGEINCKLAYVGPALGGNSDNVMYIHKHTKEEDKGQLYHSLGDNNLESIYFCNLLRPEVGTIHGVNIRFHLYSTGKPNIYGALKKVLKGVDGIVFVAVDPFGICKKCSKDHNINHIKDMMDALIEQEYNINKIPFVLQFNKFWDETVTINKSNLLWPTEIKNRISFEATAHKGVGVFETFYELANQIKNRISKVDYNTIFRQSYIIT